MTPSTSAQGFLRDLGHLLRERAIDAKLERARAVDSDDEDMKLGRLMAYYEVLSLIEEQAAAFGLDDAVVGLEGFDAGRDLL